MPLFPKGSASKPHDAAPIADQTISRDFGGSYWLDAEIGRGGIGVVYRATSRKHDRPVALKLLQRDAVGASQRPRFEREARALAALTHPNIVTILDCGVSDSVPFLAMELLEGQNLADALASKPMPMSLTRAEHIIRELLSALAFVHARGLVHRDLKPGNVFLQALPGGGERVKLLDFGLAKFLDRESGGESAPLTRTGEIFGTPGYMPPEQWTGQAVDARADVYSAAVVCFEVLAGRKPFTGEGHELLRSQMIEPAPLLHEACSERVACSELEQMLQRALAKDVGERQRDATELVAELDALPRPWLYTGSEATAGRRSAAQAVRDKLNIGTAPTLVQRAIDPTGPADVVSSGKRTITHSAPRRGALEAIGGLLHRLLVASVWTLIIVVVLAIGAAATVIYIMRSPDRVEERTALEHALPPLRDAVARGAAAAKTAVEGAVADAKEHVAAALPPEVNTTTPAEPGPEVNAATMRARDPWRDETPQELRKLRNKIDAGQRGDERMLGVLRRYNREHADDPRGHLLLARLFTNRGAWNEVVAQYELAFGCDASSRGDPRMLSDLLRAVGREVSSARASALVRVIYGREALDAIARARARARQDERVRLDRLASLIR